MDVAAFCDESRVLVVAGKGGVGKTTVSATLAWTAAAAGLSVLVIELEGKPGLHTAFGGEGPLRYEESFLLPLDRPVPPTGSGPEAPAGTIRARHITPDDALLEYLAEHGLHRVSKRLVSSGIVEVVSTAIPGIRDILVLGKVKQLERAGAADLIVVDAPATGHAVTFLTSASGLLDAARGGPVRAQAADVVEFLTDAARCRVLLVTLPEEMPVSETVEAAYQLEDRAGVRLGPVVVNAFDVPPAGLERPAEEAAAADGIRLGPAQLAAIEEARTFRLRRHELQAAQVRRLAEELPLPQVPLPQLFSGTIGPAQLEMLSGALGRGIEALVPGAPAK